MSKLFSLKQDKELLLSHFTLENLHDAVFWIDSHAQIFQVNEKACQMSGYTKEELLQMKVKDINHTNNGWPDASWLTSLSKNPESIQKSEIATAVRQIFYLYPY